jgi:hypothetical protein
MEARDFISLNYQIYNYLLETRILRKGSDKHRERFFARISDLALFAWGNHPGFFSDGRIENLLQAKAPEISLEEADPEVLRTFETHHTSGENPGMLLVASYLSEFGGHGKVVEKIIEGYKDHSIYLAVTHQREKLPASFENFERNGDLRIVRLADCGSITAKAATLRRIASELDVVVLFTHPNDPIPVLALGCGDLPPVVFDNHAHFFFSLGASVSDLVVSHAEYMCERSKERRFARETFLLPIRYSRYAHLLGKPVDKVAAKAGLGLRPEESCLVSIVLGSTVFASSGGDNFFETADEIVKRHPKVHLFLIGIDDEHEYSKRYLSLETGRIHCLGIVPDPLQYYQAADIYLDAFPYPSMGALVESITYGEACPLLFYGSHRGLLNSGNIFASEVDLNTVDSADYFARLEELLDSEEKRRAIVEILKAEQLEVEESLPAHLDALRRMAGTLQHVPRRLPDATPQFTDDDLKVASMSQRKDYLSVIQGLRRTKLLGRSFMPGNIAIRFHILILFLRHASTPREKFSALREAALMPFLPLSRKVRQLFSSL